MRLAETWKRTLVQFIVVRSAVKEHVRIEQLKNVQLKSADIRLKLSSSTGQVIRITRETFNRVCYSN